MQMWLHISTGKFGRDELDEYHILILLPMSSSMAPCHALTASQLAVVEARVTSLFFSQIKFQLQ